MNVVICDDNKILLKKYEGMVEEVAKRLAIKTNVMTFSSGEELMRSLVSIQHIDVLYLDILMDEMDGIETAKNLRQLNYDVEIVFLTSSEEYIFDSFHVKPICYLMKDTVTLDEFAEVFEKAFDICVKKRRECLMIGQEKLRFDNIYFISNIGNVYHKQGITPIVYPDTSLLEQLGNAFFMLREGTILHLKYIAKIMKDTVELMDDEHTEIRLEPEDMESLKFAFTDYMMTQI